jgi:hypothetical protein
VASDIRKEVMRYGAETSPIVEITNYLDIELQRVLRENSFSIIELFQALAME